jgi:hypothetical protein
MTDVRWVLLKDRRIHVNAVSPGLTETAGLNGRFGGGVHDRRAGASKGNVAIVREPQTGFGRLRALWKFQTMGSTEIQDMLPVYEHDLAPLRCIKQASEPVSSRFGDLTASNDEGVIDQKFLVRIAVEHLMAEHHRHLLVNLGDIGVGAL